MNENDLLLHAYFDGLIGDEEFLLLDFKTDNLYLPYWNYPKFQLNNMSDDECISEFRFQKNDIVFLCQTLQIPFEIKCYNGTVVSGIEALCICLKRLAYPCRYLDMIPRFARPVP